MPTEQKGNCCSCPAYAQCRPCSCCGYGFATCMVSQRGGRPRTSTTSLAHVHVIHYNSCQFMFIRYNLA